MAPKNAGFTLIELLASIAVMSVITAAMVSTFVTESRTSVQQERLVRMEENLRAGMLVVGGALRNAGYGVPNGNLAQWIGPGFNTFPVRITGGSPQTVDTISCTSQPVARLTAQAVINNTVLTVDTASPFQTGNLIWIGYSQFARVTSPGTSLSIDTNPGVGGNQGLTRPFPIGTPICRVDVVTFSVDGNRLLWMNRPAPVGAQVLAENIANLQLTAVTAGRRYQLTLTGQTTDIDSGALISRTLTSDIALVN